MVKTYYFSDQLDKAEEYERKLDRYFSKWYDIRTVGMDAQRRGIDRIYRNDDRKLAVEYKTDFLTQRTGNVFIETVSVDRTGKLGWAWTSQADIIVYLVAPNTIYIANPYDIRDHIEFWKQQYGERSVQNKSYKSKGIPLPEKQFAKVCKVRTLN